MSPEQFFDAVTSCLQRKDVDAARDLVAEAARSSDSDLLVAAAWTYRWLGESALALETIERATKIRETDLALYIFSRLLLEAGDWKGAVDLAKSAVQKFPASPVANFGLFETYLALRDRKQAESAARKLADVAPDSREALLAACWVENDRRKFSELLKSASRGRELYPDEPEFLIYQGRSYHGRQKLKKALDIYYRACLNQPWRQLPRALLRQAEIGYFSLYYISFLLLWLMVGVFSLFLFHLPRQAAVIVLLVPIPVAILLQRYLRSRLPLPIVTISEEESRREARQFAEDMRKQFSFRSNRRGI